MDRPDVWSMNRRQAREYALSLERKLGKAWDERDEAEAKLADMREGNEELMAEIALLRCPYHSGDEDSECDCGDR